MFALQIIIILLVVSGLIAYIGDNVGRAIGRKRVTIFKLRPKHTAIAVTIITGALIALITGAVLFAGSADVRTALFGLDTLRGLIKERTVELDKIKSDKQIMLDEISSLQKTLEASKKEITGLIRTKESLSKEIKTARSGDLLYKVNDMITTTVIDSSGSLNEIKAKLGKVLQETDTEIKKMVGGKLKHYVVITNSELDEASEYVLLRTGKIIVRIIAARNVVFGEEIPVHFELFENVMIFKRFETIATGKIDGKASRPEIEQKIKELLTQVNAEALSKGMLPGPDGSVGNIAYSRIFEVSKNIKTRNKQVSVSVESVNDTYSIGPLEVDLRIKD